MGKIVKVVFHDGRVREFECESVREEEHYLRLYREDGTGGIPYSHVLYWSVADSSYVDSNPEVRPTPETIESDMVKGSRCKCEQVSGDILGLNPRCPVHAIKHYNYFIDGA